MVFVLEGVYGHQPLTMCPSTASNAQGRVGSRQLMGVNMSHTAIVEFPCNDGSGAGLLETLKVVLIDTRAFAGNEGIETYSDQDNPDLVVLWEKWATRAEYEAYLAWRMETGLMDVLAPFMDTSKLRIVHLQAHQDV